MYKMLPVKQAVLQPLYVHLTTQKNALATLCTGMTHVTIRRDYIRHAQQTKYARAELALTKTSPVTQTLIVELQVTQAHHFVRVVVYIKIIKHILVITPVQLFQLAQTLSQQN